MPRDSSAVVVATVIFFVGFALATTGVGVLMNRKGLGLGLLARGIVVALVGSWVPTLKRPGGA